MTTQDELTAWLRPRATANELRLLDLHEPRPCNYVDGRYVGGLPTGFQCGHCADLCHSYSGLGCDIPDAPYPCATVRLIASAYAERDGYRDAWKP